MRSDINMRFVCKICNKESNATGNCQKFCSKCTRAGKLDGDRKWRLEHPEKVKEHRKKSMENGKKIVESMCDSYLCQIMGFRVSDCPVQLIEAKRAQLQLKRFVKEQTK